MSSELLEKMDILLQNEVVNRHSYFQLKYFIVGKEPTHQSKLWQCLRELKTRRDSIKAIFLELEDTNDKLVLLDIEEERIEIKKSETLLASPLAKRHLELDTREQDIKLRRLHRQRVALMETIVKLEKNLKETQDEARFFVETFESLERVEKIKPYDDLDSQKEYWNTRLTQDINTRLLLQNPIDNDLIKTVLALNNDAPIKKQALHILESQKAKLELKEKNE